MSSPGSQNLYAVLSRPPEATTVTVKGLIAKVKNGGVRVPSFQRPLRWKRADVRTLFDSVWRGYPIGSLLFWKREGAAEEITVGSARLDAPAVSDAWWVVDGQQRTTALAATLLELDHGDDKRWQLFFNPQKQSFTEDPSGPATIPLSVLGDLRLLGRWLRERDLEDRDIDSLEEAQQRILDYSIPAYVVETDDVAALRAVFSRMNSSGVRMRAEEVFHALVGNEEDKDAINLEALQQVCDENGFGQPPRGEVLKCVLAMSTLDPTRRPEKLSPQDLGKMVSFGDAADALRKTAAFLQDDCGIPHQRLLPYPVAFTILARWFYLHHGGEHSTRVRLAQWLWRGAATAAHQRASVSRMNRQIREIDDDEQQSIDRLMSHVEGAPLDQWKLQAFHHTNARARLEMLALLERKPLVNETDEVLVSSLCSGGRVAHEIFASKKTKGLSWPDTDLSKTAANRVLLDTVWTGLESTIQAWTGPCFASARASHLISDETFAALEKGDVARFLNLRAKTLSQHVVDFVNSRADWGAPTVRPHRYFSDTEVHQLGIRQEGHE